MLKGISSKCQFGLVLLKLKISNVQKSKFLYIGDMAPHSSFLGSPLPLSCRILLQNLQAVCSLGLCCISTWLCLCPCCSNCFLQSSAHLSKPNSNATTSVKIFLASPPKWWYYLLDACWASGTSFLLCSIHKSTSLNACAVYSIPFYK